jgi:hypothetical protein
LSRESLPAAALITTSASLARVSIAAAERALTLVADVSTALRAKYQLA